MAHERFRVLRVAQQSRHIAHENQAERLQRNRRFGRGDIRIAIVNLPVSTGGGTDHRRQTAPDAFAQWIHIKIDNLPDEPKIDIVSAYILEREFSAAVNIRSGKAARFAAKILDCFHNLGINLARENTFDHFGSRTIGHAMPAHEFRSHSRCLKRIRNRPAAAMHDNRINPDCFEKDNVTGDAMPLLGIGRIHKAPAVFDDKNLATKALNVRQRFEQGRGFRNYFFHSSFAKGTQNRRDVNIWRRSRISSNVRGAPVPPKSSLLISRRMSSTAESTWVVHVTLV